MKNILLSVLIVLLFSGTSLAEPCSGADAATRDINAPYRFCWNPNTEPDLKQYVIMRDGQVYDTVLHADCQADICESPVYREQIAGEYVFTVRAVDMGDNQSEDSDPVTLTVVDMPPSKPSGCSIRIP